MRGVVHAIHKNQGTRLARHAPSRSHVAYRANDVRRRSDRKQTGAGPKQLRQLVETELVRLEIEWEPLQHNAAFASQRLPRCDVPVMIELGDDHLVARGPFATEGSRNVERDRGHVVAECDLVRCAANELGKDAAGVRQPDIGLLAGGIDPVGVRVVMEQVVSHRIDNCLRYLGAPGAVEVRDRFARVHAAQRRKRRANLFDRCDRAHDVSRSRRIGWIPLGSALPPLFFITCPMKKPINFASPPRKRATSAGWAATTSSTHPASAAASRT